MLVSQEGFARSWQGPIRPAEPGDGEALAQIKVATWRSAYAEILPRALLASLTVRAERAAFEAVLLGQQGQLHVCGAPVAAYSHGDGEELFGLYVHPQAQGFGVGSALLDRTPCTRLWVFEANLRARRFYERRGFTTDGGQELYLGAPILRYRR